MSEREKLLEQRLKATEEMLLLILDMWTKQHAAIRDAVELADKHEKFTYKITALATLAPILEAIK